MTAVSLADLGREYLLAGHLIDRAGMPHVISEFGREAMEAVAIEEWMGASPVYTRRVQRALRFEGDDVPTIFKGMQFDIGAPHEFMDFRFHVLDRDHGEFWLASCGALMDVEPLGDEFVVGMCHHIEDPTFDATAAATNPRAQVRPVHRPPRVPADRHPHCRWTVEIVHDADPLPEPDAASRLAASRAAQVVIDAAGAGDYAGPFDPDLRLEHLSDATLELVLKELALQGQLLARSFMLTLAGRWGVETATRVGARQLAGIGGLTSQRLARLVGADLAGVLDLHPAFRPREYVAATVEAEDDGVVLRIGACDALAEGDDLTWPALLVRGHADAALEAIAHGVDGRARVERTGDATWVIRVDEDAEPAPLSRDVVLTSFSTGAVFEFSARR